MIDLKKILKRTALGVLPGSLAINMYRGANSIVEYDRLQSQSTGKTKGTYNKVEEFVFQLTFGAGIGILGDVLYTAVPVVIASSYAMQGDYDSALTMVGFGVIAKGTLNNLVTYNNDEIEKEIQEKRSELSL